jgi:glutamate-1-semialdehyde 2,1-aminomutase
MNTSSLLFERALRVIPGGVNSPVRAFRAVGGDPIFIERGEGPRIWDVDGNAYLDYVGSWGPLIDGHRSEAVVRALTDVIGNRGTSFGAPTALEVELAELITTLVPSIEKVRLVNSGTEATMSAIRLARGFTGRDRIVKFDGCYHGHGDSLLVRAGSGVATLGLPDSPGVPGCLAELTSVVPFNDAPAVRRLFEAVGSEIAAVIVEPVAGNMGCVPPHAGYLELLRELTGASGALLIFDEVMTGFRVAPGGAQELYRVRPDLTTLGKVIGGGLPVGAYGGRADVMDMVAPAGPVYQAGTLSGNPLAVMAGLETLRHLTGDAFGQLERSGARLERGILDFGVETGVRVQVNRVGSMLTVFFGSEPVTDFASASRADAAQFRVFFRSLLEKGVYWPPSPFEAAFVSTAHSVDDIDQTVVAISQALESVRIASTGR